MIDSTYFKKQLPRDVSAFGDSAVVEVRLLSGHFHRVQNVLDIQDGYVILEAYDLRGKEIAWKENWQEQVLHGKVVNEVTRAIVPYESILDVVVLPGRIGSQPRIGFGTRG
jgi:hypothetical protein